MGTYNWRDKTLLVVEDDEISYIFLQEIFEETEVTIIRAETGRQAINQFKAHPEIDLIIMDLQLPKMSGFDATKQIKSLNSDVPIIAQTAFALKGDRKRALEAGCDDYVTKPLDYDAFLKLLDSYLSEQK